MRIAVITDVHGNAPALEAVLKEIDRCDVQRIFCLGDMIGIGPNTNEVLHLLFSRSDVSMISGNHDEAILALYKGDEHPRSHAHAKVHHQWILDHMDQTYLPKLGQLPRIIKEEFEGHSVLFTHYHIHKSKINDPISKDPFSPIVKPRLGIMELLFEDNEESLICFGHHHPVHYFRGKGTTFLNPGSLGCHEKPTARYTILDFTRENIEVSLQETAYDKKAFLQLYETLHVPDREFILKIFHGLESR